jgi:cytochrome c-type biogenesis protein CcmE
MKSKRIKLIGVLLIFGIIIALLIASGIKKSAVYYFTLDEVISRSETLDLKNIKVSGEVKRGSIEKNGFLVKFVITEMGKELTVEYEGPLPDAFGEEAPVIVEGIYYAGERKIKAHTLLTRCPSKYEAELEDSR